MNECRNPRNIGDERTNVELSGSNIVFTTVQDSAFGKTSYGMFSSPICDRMNPWNLS